MSRSGTHRGVALLLTLVVTFFLMVLLAAFFVINKSNNSLTVNGLKRQQAYNACISGLHYAWSELEANQYWGSDGFPENTTVLKLPVASPNLILTIYGEAPEPGDPVDISKNFVEAKFPGTADGFRMVLVNNLQNRSVKTDTPLGVVPGRCAKVRVSGYSGGFNLQLESILRKKPYVDYSALSSLDMDIQLSEQPGDKKWIIASTDPYINQIHSNTKIIGPSAIDEEILFRIPPRSGVAKATDDILLGPQRESVTSDPDFLQSSESRAHGRFQVGSAPVDVPALTEHDLQFPETTVQIPPGRFGFQEVVRNEVRERVVVDSDGNEIRQYRVQKHVHNALIHNSPSGSIDDFWISQTSREDDDNSDQPWLTDSPNLEDGEFEGVPYQPTATEDFPVLYESDENHQMAANLTSGEIALSPGTKFTVSGDLAFEQEQGQLQTHLRFAHKMNPDGTMEFTGGAQGYDSMLNPQSNSAALVTSGDLSVKGISSGFGSIFANGEVSLKARSALRADPDLAVAVHGERVHLQAEDPPEGVGQSQLSAADWEFFREVVQGQSESAFDGWNERTTQQRRQVLGNDPEFNTGMRTRQLQSQQNADYIWDKLSAEIDPMPSLPNLSGYEGNWSSRLTLEHYVRLREFAKSGNPRWLDIPGDSSTFQSSLGLMDTEFGNYSDWTRRMGFEHVKQFMVPEEPASIAEVFFVGLVHAETGGLHIDTNGATFLIEGAAVSRGNMSVTNVPKVDLVYNRHFLDDVVKRFHGEFILLDQVYFKLN